MLDGRWFEFQLNRVVRDGRTIRSVGFQQGCFQAEACAGWAGGKRGAPARGGTHRLVGKFELGRG